MTDDEDKESSQLVNPVKEDDASDTGLTENQNRLLYLISLYTNIAQSDEEAEEWIRKSAVLVMTYNYCTTNLILIMHLHRCPWKIDVNISICHKKDG